MAPKKKMQLKQEEFDEAVKTNMEDFGMEADEAVASAVEEFELQGYNLDGIIKSSSGGKTDSHPVSVATRAIADSTQAASSGAAGLQDLQQRVTDLQQIFKSSTGDELKQAVAVAAKEGAVSALLAATTAAAATDSSSARSSTLLLCLRTLKPLMTSTACRSDLLAGNGAELIQQLLRESAAALDQQQGDAAGGDAQQQLQLAGSAAALAEAASWQDEEAKCRFMDMGVASDLLAALKLLTKTLQQTPDSIAAAAAAGAAAGALRAFTTADDDRPPASKAFMHARLLAGQPHNALQVLQPVLQQLQAGPDRRVGPLMAVVAAIRQIAANDEICKQFAESGGVTAVHDLLTTAVDAGPPELVRSAAAALRQLANSDGVKHQLAQAGVLATIMRAVRAYFKNPSVQEQLLGLLTALVLRMPDISAAAAEAGGVDSLTEVLAAAPAMAAEAKAAATANGGSKGAAVSALDPINEDSTSEDGTDTQDVASKVFGVGSSGGGSNGAAAAVQRQACMAIRNMVVRNPDLRPGFLAAGAEQLLRSVKVLFPGSCKDVASAALRDLGLDNYN